MRGSNNNTRLPWRRGGRPRKNGRARVGAEVGGGVLQAGVLKEAGVLRGQHAITLQQHFQEYAHWLVLSLIGVVGGVPHS